MKIGIILCFLLTFFAPLKIDAAKYELTGVSDKDSSKCLYELSIYIDSEGQPTNAADLIVKYNPNEATIIDSDKITDGVQVLPGNAFESYVYNKVEESTGTIKLTAIRFDKLIGRSIFAKIPFIAKISNPQFRIQFDGVGNTYDSNIAEYNTSDDILDSIKEDSLSLNNFSCSLTSEQIQDVSIEVDETVTIPQNLNSDQTLSIAATSSLFTIVLLAVIALFLIILFKKRIKIVDDKNKPIEGAMLNIIKNGVFVGSYVTNNKGYVKVPRHKLHKTIEVSAKGYKSENLSTGLRDSEIVLNKD